MAVALGVMVAFSAAVPGAAAEARDAGGDERAPNLIAFVGRRLSARAVPPKRGVVAFDGEYRARFEVLDVVFGTYEPREIEFVSYVHGIEPAFVRHELGLVYVSRRGDRFVQQKYLFQRLYRTSDGRWASCGDPYTGVSSRHRHAVRPEPISFDPPVTFDVGPLDAKAILATFPAPLFRVDGKTATCLMGNRPPELFRVMAEGYLKHRGVFEPVRE